MYKDVIPLRKYWWWLRSPGSSASFASAVSSYGYIDSGGRLVNYGSLAVVPALCVNLLDNFKIGDKFWFGGCTFTIISDIYALCDNNIGECTFRKEWKAEDANLYAQSDVKKCIEEWFDRSCKECNTDLYKPSDDKESAGISETALYSIPYAFEMYGRIEVEARSLLDAYKKAKEQLECISEADMMANASYLDDSLAVDEDGLVLKDGEWLAD